MMTTEEMTAQRPSDGELVAQCLEDRRDAFEHIVERYQSLICSLAYSATGSLNRSEDLAQETFLVAWKQLAELREPAKLRPWLCGIARNLIGKALRRDVHEPLAGAESLDAAQGSAGTEPLPLERVIGQEEEAILWRSIEHIPELYREPLVLFYREHQSAERVAAALDLTPDTVRQRLLRRRKLLHQQVIAFVEGTLESTSPGKAFTVGVLAALPVLAASGISASAATAGTLAAKGGVTGKAVTGLSALAAVLTAAVIANFSLIGFIVFLGACVGYLMTQSIKRSTSQMESVSRFWREVAAGFGVFAVIPLALTVGLRLRSESNPRFCYGLSLWMELIFLFVPAAVAMWFWRWRRDSMGRGTDVAAIPRQAERGLIRWLALGMFVPTLLALWSSYSITFKSTWSSEHLSAAEFQKIVTQRKDADFQVCQGQNGMKTLAIRLPESRRRVVYFAPADDTTLALLDQNRIAYRTSVDDPASNVLGTPWRLLNLLCFFLTPAGGLILLMRPWRKELCHGQIELAQAQKANRRAGNVFRAFSAALALGLLALASLLGLMTRWHARTVTDADLPTIIAQHRFARYAVARYENGSSQLTITPRENPGSPFRGPAGDATLSLLKEKHIPYSTLIQGRDFGYDNPTPLFSLIFIILLTTGAILLLWRAGKGIRWTPAFIVGFLAASLLGFRASTIFWQKGSNTYFSTARVQVAEWANPSFPGDEIATIKSKPVLEKADDMLDLDHKWGRRWLNGGALAREATLDRLGRFIWVDVIPLGQTGAIEVTVGEDDPTEASDLANAVTDAYCNLRNQARAAVQILDRAVPAPKPMPGFAADMMVVSIAASILLGLVAGAAAARLHTWFRKRSQFVRP